MMQQSNALRKLEKILTEAVSNGDRNQPSGLVLLKAMQLSDQPHNIVEFFELLNKAKEEAKSVKKPNIDRYLQPIVELHHFFVVNHLWGSQWEVFCSYIEARNLLNTLDALADFFYDQNPAIFLEQDFLDKLQGEFKNILDEVVKSDLSEEMRRFLTARIEDILKAIRRYYIDGTEGLEKATKSLVSDLVTTEHGLKESDKKNPTFRKIQALVLSVIMYVAPGPYDIIGAVPDIHDFWIPKYEELAAGQKKVEEIVCSTPTIQEAFKEASKTFDRQQQKRITGGEELKALPASPKDPEVIIEEENIP